jgi:hypothetical protein
MPIVKTGRPSVISTKCVVVAMGHKAVLASHLASSKAVVEAAKDGKMHGEIERRSDGTADLAAEIKKHPDALWLRVKAIEADRENDNGDYFSEAEIIKAYKTFEGCPVFTNHENSKVENAKGKVVLAEWDDEDKSVYCTLFIDRGANPALCRAVEEGYVTDVSMGTQVDYSICSVCKNKSYTADTYCPHVKTMKGRSVDGKKIYEENYGLKFIEISVVTDGACKDCTIREVIDPADFVQQAQESLRSAAASLKTIKEGTLHKDGGQGEIEMLNAAMENIEQVLRSMLDQRQYIDLEFMNDLTEVFADLQHVTDELVDQGYGSLGQAPAQPQEMGVPPMTEPTEGGAAPEPFAAGPTPTGVGSVTRPAEAASETKIGSPASRIQKKVKDLQERMAKIQEGINETAAPTGGKDVTNEENRQKTIEKLANVWQNPSVRQFTTEVAEGDYKIIVGKEEVLGLRGGKKVASLKVVELDPDIRQALRDDPQKTAATMLDAFKERQASMQKKAEAAPVDAQEQWGQTMEAQLRDQNPPLHPRENEVRHQVTESQLQSEYRGYDWHKQGLEDPRHCVTEKQLWGLSNRKDFPGYDRHGPQDEPRDEITEKQLRNEKWKGNTTPATSDKEWTAGVSDQKQQITEGQLTDWKAADEAHLPEHRITEKQLREQADPLGRRVASVTKENAKEVIAKAKKAIGLAAVAAGASPEDVIAASNEFQANPRNGMAALRTVDAFASKKLAVAKDAGIKDHLLSSLSEEFTPDVALVVLKVIANDQKAVENLSKAIAEASKKPEKEPDADKVLMEALAAKEDEPKEEKKPSEEVKVIMTVADVKADLNDKAAFAKAAFEQATKLASAQGVSVTKNVHVKRNGDDVEVALEGVRQASKEEKKAAKCQCGTDCECKCEGDPEKCKCEAKKASSEKQTKLAQRADDRKKVVEGQFGGGGGGMPAPGFEAGGPGAAGGTTMPTPAPAGAPAGAPEVGALGEEPPPTADAMDETPESMPPGSICPSCGSDDVDVKGGDFGCNNCGAEGSIEVNLKMRNWPDTIQEKGPEKGGGEEPGIGEMEGGPGIEMPEVGVAAVFKVTPEMVKVSGQKPIGSFCPHCGSPKVKLAENKHSGQCQQCNGKYRIDTYWEPTDNCLVGRIAWHDNNVRRLASKKRNNVKVAMANAAKNASAMGEKKETLEIALKAKGWTSKFASASLKEKAMMIGELAEQGLIRKD